MYSALIQSDLVVFSHLRWDFIFQRPQHLMTRFQQHQRVFFVEEPVFVDSITREGATYVIHERGANLKVVVPQLSPGLDEATVLIQLKNIVQRALGDFEITRPLFWYYTPAALKFTRDFKPVATIYDCMDELSAFKFASPELPKLEQELLARADVVFTGGHALYEAKRHHHHNIHPVPSSIDFDHFYGARTCDRDPADQASIGRPRLGYYGAIDERLDYNIIDELSRSRPEWNIVMIGPVVKVRMEDLPQRANIHYLGGKSYSELPHYLAGWDIALLPFAINASTKFISPTKTPEYLAGGKPAVSTPIQDVIRPYGELKMVHIASRPNDFIEACDIIMQNRGFHPELKRVDAFLKTLSWDRTWAFMAEKICEQLEDARSATLRAPIGRSSFRPAAASLSRFPQYDDSSSAV